MRRRSHDFFSDPLWPHEHPSPLDVNKSHSSEQSVKEESRDKEPLDSATGTNDCIAHYIKIEELSNSIELLSNPHDSASKKNQQEQQPMPADEEPQYSDGQLWDLSAQIEQSLTSQQSSFQLPRQNFNRYRILSKQAKQFLVQEIRMTSITYVSKKYGIAANNLCRWKKSCQRRRGAGRKITDAKLEERLIKWIKEQKERNVELTRKQIQTNAKLWAEDKNFKASKGWFERFARRNAKLDLLCFLQPRERQQRLQRHSFFPFVKFQELYSEDAHFSRLSSCSNPRLPHLRNLTKSFLRPQ